MSEWLEANEHGLSAQELRQLSQITEQIREVSNNRYRDPSILNVTADTLLLRATEQARARQRNVIFMITRPNSNRGALQLGYVRDALNKSNDALLGVEYASYSNRLSDGLEWACLVTNFHDNTGPLLDYVSVTAQDIVSLTYLLSRMAQQLSSLHDSGYTHGDVAATNFIVSESGAPHLIDFELCQPLQIKLQDFIVGGTPTYTHPKLLTRLASAQTSNTPVDPDERIRWDIYGLGRTYLQLLEKASNKTYSNLDPYEQRALRLIATRCLDGENKPTETALGLMPADFADLKYRRIADIIDDLAKIIDRSKIVLQVPELDLSNPDRVQASNMVPLVRTQRLDNVLNTGPFRRLAHIKQLGLVELIYPTANHTRSEHALGTYAMACEYIRWLLRDDTNPFFSQVAQAADMRALVLAALLHDLGHYPLAHDFEDADRMFDHEARTARILREDTNLRAVIENPEPDGWQVPVERVIAILSADEDSDASLLDQILHTIVSGPIDADKLDYLRRDSARTGTNYGDGIDLARLSTTATVILRARSSDDGNNRTVGAIGTMEKGVSAAETVAFARYTMFRSVYWHHAYRSVKAMIQFMILDMLRSERAKSRLKYRSRLSAELDQLFIGESGSLFSGHQTFSSESALPIAEDAILRWVDDHGSILSHGIYRRLANRTWFKRLVVLSLKRDLDQETLRLLSTLFAMSHKKRDREQWIRRLLIQRVFQRMIAERVSEIEEGEIGTVIFDRNDARQKFLSACQSSQVLLVDFPDPERTLPGNLLFSIEETYVRSKIDSARAISSETSAIFDDIATGFVPSIGKLRILIAAEHRDFLQRFLQKQTIAKLFRDALGYVASLQVPTEDDDFTVWPTHERPS